MSRPMPRLAVFDLAGTTMQDDGCIAPLFHQVLASEGLTATAEEIAQIRGASKREAFRRLAGEDALAERLCTAFLASIHEHCANNPLREVAGASMLFAWLRDQGVQIALNTGFDRATLALLLDALGWQRETFDAIVCGDEVAVGRPSPAMLLEAMRRVGINEPFTVMVVGDTVLDLQAGMAAQAGWVVGVTSGAHDRARLSQTPHTHLIASVANIRELLR
jgi:phosphoglycolate phosphatase